MQTVSAENKHVDSHGVGPMKLLIIDDEVTIVETVETKFRKEGYTTFTANSAEEGMRKFPANISKFS